MEEFFTDNIGRHFWSAVQAGQVKFHQRINPETALWRLRDAQIVKFVEVA